jgi:hypothetical protein
MIYKKNDIIRDSSRIVISRDGYNIVNPSREMILADGWEPYTAPEIPEQNIDDQLRELLLDQYNGRTDITDADALKRPLLAYDWSAYLNKSLTTGQIVRFEDKLWRVRQDIAVVLENQTPGTTTAALYEVIEVEPAGTADDPIPYTPPMEIFDGKYYTQGGVLYHCTRSSGQALTHNLSDLVGIYVETIN